MTGHGPGADETVVRDCRVPFRPRLSSDEVLEAARLCVAVYRDRPAIAGWETLSLRDLGLPDGYGDEAKFVNRNAAAFVRTATLGGERVLAVCFQGTNPASLADWGHNVLGNSIHYGLLAPLVDAIDRYVAANGVARVIVAGHSLGGAMAERFMALKGGGRDPDGGPAYVGVTFGSPGTEPLGGARDPRVVEFRHKEDVVPRIGRLSPFVEYEVPGRLVELDDTRRHECPVLGPFQAHRMEDYVRSVVRLRRDGGLDRVLARTDDVRVSFDGRSGAIEGMAAVQQCMSWPRERWDADDAGWPCPDGPPGASPAPSR